MDDLTIIRFDNASTLGLRAENLIADDWGPCQAAADRLRSDRAAPKVLQTPSAALPGAQNIVILDERVAIPWSFEPVDPIDLPVTLAAAGARPPKSLIELTRFRGDPHLEYEAWARGDKFELVEPSDALLARETA